MKILVAMSGGVDSSVTALLLKRAGWDPIGISFRLPVWGNKEGNIESCKRAEAVCKKIGMDHEIYDLRDRFEDEIVSYFVRELEKGRTPNPCVMCNKKFKFHHLLEVADTKDIEMVATGHYARVVHDKVFKLMKAKDGSKDQTYYLSLLDQEHLSRLIFPAGDHLKSEIYEIAREAGLDSHINQSESQNFCYLSNSSMSEFLRDRLGDRRGEIVDERGGVLGEHNGIWLFTIGQRKGLGLPGGPYYVKEFDVHNNTVLVTKDEIDIYSREIILESLNITSKGVLSDGDSVMGRIRYGAKEEAATIHVAKKVKVVFDRPQLAPAPGQFCVLYRGEECLGGGITESVL